MLSPRGAATLSTAAVLARVTLACLGWGETLSARLELSSPADSVLRLREGKGAVDGGGGGATPPSPPVG